MSKLEQYEAQKGTWFTSVTHDLKLAQDMIQVLPDFQSWAYIKHLPDKEDSTEHFHFLIRANGTRSIKQVADKLGIPSNYVQICRKVVAFRRYMMHLDSDDKIKYDVDDIVSNSKILFEQAKIGNEKKDILTIYNEYKLLIQGKMTSDEFVQSNFIELSNMPFYQKIKTFDIIFKSSHGTT